MRSIRTLVSKRIGLVKPFRLSGRRTSTATTVMADQTPSKTPTAQPDETAELPELTPAEFRVYNNMADIMNRYHNHFRQTWNMLYKACEANKRPAGMSIRQFMSAADRLIQSLTMHHTIEEEHIFPVLAKKMPAFKKELDLLTQHKRIHEGLDKLDDYLRDCRRGETEFRMSEMKNVMDTFGKVLWEHLDDEVHQLGANNMRRYWTLEEMRRMPM